MNEDVDNYYKNWLDIEDVAAFLTPRLYSRDVLLDDPLDFINGFNLGLAYAFKAEIYNNNEEARFRISLALWLRRFIDDIEKGGG
tara:strand:+ start:218 stop:472 length:255 start_codon:yes stop_codon:yes gene_type:complete